MIEDYLGLDIWQQIVISVLFIGGILCWIYGITVAILEHRRKEKEVE